MGKYVLSVFIFFGLILLLNPKSSAMAGEREKFGTMGEYRQVVKSGQHKPRPNGGTGKVLPPGCSAKGAAKEAVGGAAGGIITSSITGGTTAGPAAAAGAIVGVTKYGLTCWWD